MVMSSRIVKSCGFVALTHSAFSEARKIGRADPQQVELYESPKYRIDALTSEYRHLNREDAEDVLTAREEVRLNYDVEVIAEQMKFLHDNHEQDVFHNYAGKLFRVSGGEITLLTREGDSNDLQSFQFSETKEDVFTLRQYAEADDNCVIVEYEVDLSDDNRVVVTPLHFLTESEDSVRPQKVDALTFCSRKGRSVDDQNVEDSNGDPFKFRVNGEEITLKRTELDLENVVEHQITKDWSIVRDDGIVCMIFLICIGGLLYCYCKGLCYCNSSPSSNDDDDKSQS